jgi:hypothetical protein
MGNYTGLDGKTYKTPMALCWANQAYRKEHPVVLGDVSITYEKPAGVEVQVKHLDEIENHSTGD